MFEKVVANNQRKGGKQLVSKHVAFNDDPSPSGSNTDALPPTDTYRLTLPPLHDTIVMYLRPPVCVSQRGNQMTSSIGTKHLSFH